MSARNSPARGHRLPLPRLSPQKNSAAEAKQNTKAYGLASAAKGATIVAQGRNSAEAAYTGGISRRKWKNKHRLPSHNPATDGRRKPSSESTTARPTLTNRW